MTLKEVKEGLDFRESVFYLSMSRPTRDKITEIINDCFTITHNVIATSRTKYEKEFVKVKGKRYLRIGKNYNGYQIIGNKKGENFGVLNTSNNTILIAPEYDSISTISLKKWHPELYFNIMIGHKGNYRTLIIKNKKVLESEYDFGVCSHENFHKSFNCKYKYLKIRNGDLFGFVNLYDLNESNNSFNWKLIEPKYTSLHTSILFSEFSGVLVFEVTDRNGETFFVNKDGVEFRR